MTFNEYQNTAKNYRNYPEGIGVYYGYLALNSEIGKLSDKIKLSLEDNYEINDKERQKLGITLADIIFWCTTMCTEMGLNLEDIMMINLYKLNMLKEKAINEKLDNNLNNTVDKTIKQTKK